MKRGREIPAPFFLAEIENQAPVELPQRRIAHAEAGAHVFGEQFDGGPVGVATISAAIGEDASTLEEVYEPFLVQQGFLQRTPRGRVATAAAYRHFGFVPPRL